MECGPPPPAPSSPTPQQRGEGPPQTAKPQRTKSKKSDANNTEDDNITYFSKTLISIDEKDIPKTSNENITPPPPTHTHV